MGIGANAVVSQPLMARTSASRFSRLTIWCPSSSNIRHSTVQPAQRVEHLLRLAGRDVGVVGAVYQQQRGRQCLDPQQRRQPLEQFTVVDRVAVLGIRRCRDPWLGVAVERGEVAHPADADAGGEKLGVEGQRRLSQVATVGPAAAADAVCRQPTSRSTRKRTQSATSSIAANRNSLSSACMKVRPNPPEPRIFGVSTVIPASSSGKISPVLAGPAPRVRRADRSTHRPGPRRPAGGTARR